MDRIHPEKSSSNHTFSGAFAVSFRGCPVNTCNMGPKQKELVGKRNFLERSWDFWVNTHMDGLFTSLEHSLNIAEIWTPNCCLTGCLTTVTSKIMPNKHQTWTTHGEVFVHTKIQPTNHSQLKQKLLKTSCFASKWQPRACNPILGPGMDGVQLKSVFERRLTHPVNGKFQPFEDVFLLFKMVISNCRPC